MTSISLDRLAQALGVNDERACDSHSFATVSSVNPDGSYQVVFNGAITPARAVRCCDASAGDRVLCLVSNGQVSAIGKVGGGGTVPAVLYDNPQGYNGNITLEDSAANYDYMRIYYFVHRDSDIEYASTDVYEPNGKVVSLFAVRNANRDAKFHYAGATYAINGTSLTMGSQGVADSGGGFDGSWNTYIYRVEAWSGGASIGFGGGSGGGGGAGSQIDLLWTNPNPTSNFAAQTLSGIPWQDYKFLFIDHYTAGNGNVAAHYETSVISTDNPSAWSWITCIREVPFGRGVKFPANNQVQFGSQTYYSTYNGANATMYDDWQFIVPTKIWGVKDGGGASGVVETTCTLNTTYASTGRSTVKCSKNGGVCTITFMPLVLKAQSGRNTFGTVPEGFRPVHNEYYIHPNGWGSESYLIVGTDGTLKANVTLGGENESRASGTYVIGG